MIVRQGSPSGLPSSTGSFTNKSRLPLPSIPWHDQATLIRTTDASIHDGGRTIVAEAPLHRLVELASTIPPAELDRHYITLPDRRAAPYRFDGAGINALLGRLDRPGAFNFTTGRPARRV